MLGRETRLGLLRPAQEMIVTLPAHLSRRGLIERLACHAGLGHANPTLLAATVFGNALDMPLPRVAHSRQIHSRTHTIARKVGCRVRGRVSDRPSTGEAASADRVGGGQVAVLAGLLSALPLPADAATTITSTTDDVGAVVTPRDGRLFSLLRNWDPSKGANERRDVYLSNSSFLRFILHANLPVSASSKYRSSFEVSPMTGLSHAMFQKWSNFFRLKIFKIRSKKLSKFYEKLMVLTE